MATLPSESLAPDSDDGQRRFAPEDGSSLLRECFAIFAVGMRKAVRTSSETATDLFEAKGLVSDEEELDFLIKRDAWIDRFGEVLSQLFERRLAGIRRKGRRPDADVSLATVRVLNAFDQEKQAALTVANRVLQRWAKKELDALDLRIGELLNVAIHRDVDNPFAPDYIVDALGASGRALFPNPRLWRPFMERVLTDITPAVPKIYISLNRFLADHGVLPEIKAALRARSELRPLDDKDLLPLFSRLLHEVGAGVEGLNVEVPPVFAGASPPAPSSAAKGASPATQAVALDPEIAIPLGQPLPGEQTSEQRQEAVRATATIWPGTAPPPSAPLSARNENSAFPDLDPMLALGTSSPVFAVLAQWQSFDPQNETTQRELASRGIDTSALPLNRIPYVRVAMGQQAVSATDKITMDVISLLFDYIFRDPSIPESSRGIFGRLQIPVLKAALLDRAFFSDKRYPARRFLDRLASTAVGASTDKAYRIAFEGIATRLVDQVCNEFQLDVAVFDRADAKLVAFVDGEQRTTAEAMKRDVATALQAEEGESDRAQVKALIRDRLAGLVVPFDVRSFSETIWADYVTVLRKDKGDDSDEYWTALQTIDDLLWSITAKERTAQKARLTKMVPGIIGNLRKGLTRLQVRDDRAKAFFDTLYKLHIAAIKPRPRKAASPRFGGMGGPVTDAGRGPRSVNPSPTAGGGDGPAKTTAPASAAAPADDDLDDSALAATHNVHDFVSEMIVGTWLEFQIESEVVNARLSWISPLRTKYIFTSRSRARALVYAPEELAWEIGAGHARPLVEPVPLFDRAVSAALDTLASHRPEGSRSGTITALPV